MKRGRSTSHDRNSTRRRSYSRDRSQSQESRMSDTIDTVRMRGRSPYLAR